MNASHLLAEQLAYFPFLIASRQTHGLLCQLETIYFLDARLCVLLSVTMNDFNLILRKRELLKVPSAKKNKLEKIACPEYMASFFTLSGVHLLH